MQALAIFQSSSDRADLSCKLRKSRVLSKLLSAAPEFDLHAANSPQRHQLERYITRCFARAYNAEVTEFSPLLLDVKCAGNISGVAGIRMAETSPLFLEHYLDAPVEEVVANTFGEVVSRHEIVEIGNLAALRPGACQLMLLMLAGILHAAGFRYAAFAGTDQVVRTVHKLSEAVRAVGIADPSRLGIDAKHWGSYYDTSPQVMIVDLAATKAIFDAQRLPAAVFAVYESRIHVLAAILSGYKNCATDRSDGLDRYL
jgi:hypothetical protein